MWGAISRRGGSSLAIFEGIMDSKFYQEILRDHLLNFIERIYPEGHRFQQDNDPKHVSRSTKEWMAEHNVNYWPTPPESPDLNPIENVWHQMKEHLRRHVKPSTKEELIRGIGEAWKLITPTLCNRYINHLFKVIPKVVAEEGGPSGY